MTGQLVVRRSGGFIGRTVSGSLDLGGPDPRAVEAQALLDQVDLATVPTGLPYPDMFSYAFDLDGLVVTVPEHLLPDPLRRLAALVLAAPEA